MSTASRKLNYATISNYDVEAGQTVTVGRAVVMTATGTVQDAPAQTDLSVGVAMTGGTGAASDNVNIALGGCAVAVLLNGAATAGNKAQFDGTGFLDAAAVNPAGATSMPTHGVFIQAGLTGDIVGMWMEHGNRITT